MNEIYNFNDTILILPGHPEKPIPKGKIEYVLQSLYKAGVIDDGTFSVGKNVWKPEDEERRRELAWRDFQESTITEGPEIAGIISSVFKCDILFDKNAFMKNPEGYISERMNTFVKWAENKKKEVVGFVERTMKVYGPEEQR